MIKIKLLYPPVTLNYHMLNEGPPLGLATITSFLRQKGLEVDQDDLQIKISNYNKEHPNSKINLDLFNDRWRVRKFMDGQDDHELEKSLDKILGLTDLRDCKVVGFSLHALPSEQISVCLARRVKEKTQAIIVFGGVCVTINSKDIMRESKYVDYCVIGHGELPLFFLVDKLLNKKTFPKDDLKNIPGLIYRKNNKLHLNKPQPINLNSQPIPDFDGFPLELYKVKFGLFKKTILCLPYAVNYGCSGRCTFCSNHRLYKYNSTLFHIKPIEKIIKELKYLKNKYSAGYFFFCGDNINDYKDINNQHLISLCKNLISENVEIFWGCYAKPINLNSEVLKLMRKAGCRGIWFGVETGSDKIRKKMGKRGFLNSEIEEVLKNSYNAGITNSIWLIVGYPGEDQEDLNETISFIKRNAKYIQRITSRILIMNKDSIVFDNPKAFGFKILKRSPVYGYFNYAALNEDPKGFKEKQDEAHRKIRQVINKYIHKKNSKLSLSEIKDNIFVEGVNSMIYDMFRTSERIHK